MKIGIDVGGVVSKYPEVFWQLINALAQGSSGVEVHFVSDMPKAKTAAMLGNNGYGDFPLSHIHEADHEKYGETCKAVLCEELGIDVLIDDHGGYLASLGRPTLRLLVMPDPHLPYYDPDWKDENGVAHGGGSTPAAPPESKHPHPSIRWHSPNVRPETPTVNQRVRLKRSLIHPTSGATHVSHGSEGTVRVVWEDIRLLQVAFGGCLYFCRPEDLEVIG